jgi:hypothetical protein
MSHVKSLEHDLSEIGQTLGDGSTNGVLSNEGFIKQTDNGKRLLQQLQAMKHMAASTTESENVPKAPVEEIDGKVCAFLIGDIKPVLKWGERMKTDDAHLFFSVIRLSPTSSTTTLTTQGSTLPQRLPSWLNELLPLRRLLDRLKCSLG